MKVVDILQTDAAHVKISKRISTKVSLSPKFDNSPFSRRGGFVSRGDAVSTLCAIFSVVHAKMPIKLGKYT